MRPNWTARNIHGIIWTVIITCLFFLVVFPFFWMVIASVRSFDQLSSVKSILSPKGLTIKPYINLLRTTDFIIWLRNSVFIACVSTFIALVIGSFSAYGLVRFGLPAKRHIAGAVLTAYLVPETLLFIPFYTILSKIGLLDSIYGLMVVYLTRTVPFSTWLLMGFYKNLPMNFEESALVDGCSRLQAFMKIVLPLSISGLVTVGIFSFSRAWNEYVYALIFISSKTSLTIPLGLSKFVVGDVFFWDKIMAGSVISTLPMAAGFLFVQKYLVSGFTAGGIKG